MAELDIPRPAETVHMSKACRDEEVGVDEGREICRSRGCPRAGYKASCYPCPNRSRQFFRRE